MCVQVYFSDVSLLGIIVDARLKRIYALPTTTTGSIARTDHKDVLLLLVLLCVCK